MWSKYLNEKFNNGIVFAYLNFPYAEVAEKILLPGNNAACLTLVYTNGTENFRSHICWNAG